MRPLSGRILVLGAVMVVCAALVDHYCAALDLHRLRGLGRKNSIYDGDLTVRPLSRLEYVQLARARGY